MKTTLEKALDVEAMSPWQLAGPIFDMIGREVDAAYRKPAVAALALAVRFLEAAELANQRREEAGELQEGTTAAIDELSDVLSRLERNRVVTQS